MEVLFGRVIEHRANVAGAQANERASRRFENGAAALERGGKQSPQVLGVFDSTMQVVDTLGWFALTSAICDNSFMKKRKHSRDCQGTTAHFMHTQERARSATPTPYPTMRVRRERLNAGVFALLCSTAILTACATDGKQSNDAGVTSRDSAGVRIMENRAPLWSAGHEWKLSDTPVTQIGTVGGKAEYNFDGISGMTRLSDGTIVVADHGSSQLRFFSPDGRFLSVAGGSGEGPGEFRDLIGLARLHGDTLVANNQSASYALFSSNGKYLRSIQVQKPDGFSFVTLLGFFDDGSFLGRSWPNSAPGFSGITTDSVSFARFRNDGTPANDLGRFPTATYSHKGTTPLSVAFGPTMWAVASGTRFFVGYSSKYEIARYSIQGTLELLIRKSGDADVVTAADTGTFKAQARNAVRLPSGLAVTSEREALRDSIVGLYEFAKTHPPFSDGRVDSAGNLWVMRFPLQVYREPGSNYSTRTPHVYSVFDSTGRWLGDLTMPKGFVVREIGNDYLLGIKRNDDGVEFVYQYALEKTR